MGRKKKAESSGQASKTEEKETNAAESRVEKSVAGAEKDIFDDMVDDLHDSHSEFVDEEEEALIKEHGTKEEEIDEPEEEEQVKESREDLKETILQKATLLGSRDTEQKPGLALKFLEDEKEPNVFIGRKRPVFKKFGYEAAFFVGKVNETEHKEKNVFLDGLNPHVVFVCGARGSGKSYFLGVIAEELALKNKNVGTIIVDPIGVFWSMRFPNREEKEIERLGEWGLEPKGLTNLKVFIPKGMIPHVPKSTFDAGFSMQPALLESEDWALTFGIDRFSVTGLLLEKVLKKVESGFREIETGKKIVSKGRNYSMDDIIHCLEKDDELNSREKGFKADSIRALVSRFEAAKAWGIFDDKGTPLSELSRAGQLTILDTSFLDDMVTSLVVGILARRILSARKLSTRKEAAEKFKAINVEQILELEIPPTWLVVDEAHTLIPSGNVKTPASKALTEYVKQGRRPGCSLVFATQQPSAIDTKVLSQLDVILVHKLVFDDDIKAVYKRTPTIIPGRYKKGSFIKTLPVGVALTGDRQEETSRAFVMKVRPRFSQHEGRDMESTGTGKSLPKKQVFSMALELIENDIASKGMIENDRIRQFVETMNSKYSTDVKTKEVFAELEKNGFVLGSQRVARKQFTEDEKEPTETEEEMLAGVKNAEEALVQLPGKEDLAKPLKVKAERLGEEFGEQSQLISLPLRVREQSARKLFDSVRKKKTLGFFGKDEQLSGLKLKNHTIWKVEFDVITRAGREFISKNCFVDSITGEFVHFSGGSFVESNGLKHFFQLNDESLIVLKSLDKSRMSLEDLSKQTGFDTGTVHRVLKRLAENNLIGRIAEKEKSFYVLKEKLDIPPSETHSMLDSLNLLPFSKTDVVEKEMEIFSKSDVTKALSKLWKNVVVKRVTEVYRPVWIGLLSSGGEQRTVLLDAVTGKVIN